MLLNRAAVDIGVLTRVMPRLSCLAWEGGRGMVGIMEAVTDEVFAKKEEVERKIFAVGSHKKLTPVCGWGVKSAKWAPSKMMIMPKTDKFIKIVATNYF